MSVKAELAFDVCWDVYRGAREILESKRGVGALNLEVTAKYTWQPDLQPKLKDCVADFALAGQTALAMRLHLIDRSRNIFRFLFGNSSDLSMDRSVAKNVKGN